jgi:hypothetical protein
MPAAVFRVIAVPFATTLARRPLHLHALGGGGVGGVAVAAEVAPLLAVAGAAKRSGAASRSSGRSLDTGRRRLIGCASSVADD